MSRNLNSFKIQAGNKILDYRTGRNLNLAEVKAFFSKKYQVQNIWSGPRHIFGLLKKGNITLFLKLSTSEGISLTTRREFEWNNYFQENFPGNLPFGAPENFDSGFYKKIYFYIICDYFQGNLLCSLNAGSKEINKIADYIPSVVEFSRVIQNLPAGRKKETSLLEKTKNWFFDIPENIRKKYEINILLKIAESGIKDLNPKPRHGDFTPWHLIESKGKLIVFDGEHWQSKSVENYDICYFIQRIFAVLKNPDIAQKIYAHLKNLGYEQDKLKTVLAARAIGGFLDESLNINTDYRYAEAFKKFVTNI